MSMPETVLERWREEARTMSRFELFFWMMVCLIPTIIVTMAENAKIFAEELDCRRRPQP